VVGGPDGIFPVHDRSPSHAAAEASDGMRQSPRGDRLIEPTFGPSGRHDRHDLLNWLAKNSGA